MARAQGLTLVELDSRSSTPNNPVGIITADCSGATEFDDGIAITPLASHQELYKVSVFAVDTSALYYDDDITQRVLDRTRTIYEDLEGGGRFRDPMLAPEITKDLHFSARSGARKALVVSFIVGAAQAPSEVDISFGHVEVRKNYAFSTFANLCRFRKTFKEYGRAAAYILNYLEKDPEPVDTTYKQLVETSRVEDYQRGANILKAFTVGAGHLVAKTASDENRPIIYRTHYPGNQFDDRKEQPLAFFSTTPAPHIGLGLNVFSRITCPLRQAEDFMTMGQLHGREIGRSPSTRDKLLLQETVRRLNAPIFERAAELASA